MFTYLLSCFRRCVTKTPNDFCFKFFQKNEGHSTYNKQTLENKRCVSNLKSKEQKKNKNIISIINCVINYFIFRFFLLFFFFFLVQMYKIVMVSLTFNRSYFKIFSYSEHEYIYVYAFEMPVCGCFC